MIVDEANIHNIMSGIENTSGVRLHSHKRKLKQRFDIIRKLGQGTYGKVQLGINKENGQEVAIKTIKKCKIETVADLIRIRREIQIMSSVQHPNIIHIYEVFENKEKMVLVMEYAAGGELYDYLSERKVLTEHEARRIFRQIATAIFYCHKHKICHRDLKLENILLDQDGNAKIADFGLSNVFDEHRRLNTFCGSPLYASPEIVKGTPYHGPEVDCWSLGVLLYTLVYGAMPFDGSNFKRLVKQISESDYFEPKKLSPASSLIKDMLMVCPLQRANIEKICMHWWVNEGYECNCLKIAEDLAAQTPVRLDLLLSIVPQSTNVHNIVVNSKAQTTSLQLRKSSSLETILPPFKCHSTESLSEFNQNSEKKISELIGNSNSNEKKVTEAKRKLQTTLSVEKATPKGIKKKECVRRKHQAEEGLKSYSSKHCSASASKSNLEEVMDVDHNTVLLLPLDKTNSSNSEISSFYIKPKMKKGEYKNDTSKEVLIESRKKIKKKNKIINEKPERIQSDINNPMNKESLGEINMEKTLKNTDEQKIFHEKSLQSKKTKNISNDVILSKPNQLISKTVFAQKDGYEFNDRASMKKIKSRSLSLDSELSSKQSLTKLQNDRQKSKIFETTEKFTSLVMPMEKPKKIFIPGVNVGGTKLAFEKKASRSLITVPQSDKASISKIIIDVPVIDTDSKYEKSIEAKKKIEYEKQEKEKKRAVNIITEALGKPPIQRKLSIGSAPTSSRSNDSIELTSVDSYDSTNQIVTVFLPDKFESFSELKSTTSLEDVAGFLDQTNFNSSNSITQKPRKSSKMEIMLKSATLPRPRKTSKAEITLSNVRPFETDLLSNLKIENNELQQQNLGTSLDIIFPKISTVSQGHHSLSFKPEKKKNELLHERIIPIRIEPISQQVDVSSTISLPKSPKFQYSISQHLNSPSRQLPFNFDTHSNLEPTLNPDPIKKSSREYIIPIAVEGKGYITPTSRSVKLENDNSKFTSVNLSESKFSRCNRIGSILPDANIDELSYSSINRNNNNLVQRHLHRLRSSRPSRQTVENADSLSSGEDDDDDDDDDGFELLTAENLFSTLLSRVRSLTQRLNVDDKIKTPFTSGRLLGRTSSYLPHQIWDIHQQRSSKSDSTEKD